MIVAALPVGNSPFFFLTATGPYPGAVLRTVARILRLPVTEGPLQNAGVDAERVIDVDAVIAKADVQGDPTDVRAAIVVVFELLTLFERHGGVALHGALLARPNGRAVILCGPGGVGKSTAARRAPATWRAWCDDTALIFPDGTGGYQAHPWPTWSELFEGATMTWDVGTALPLDAVLVLARADQDHAEPVGKGEAVALLTTNTEQVLGHRSRDAATFQARRARRFENLIGLAGTVPVGVLHFTQHGRYWEAIDRFLEQDFHARPLG